MIIDSLPLDAISVIGVLALIIWRLIDFLIGDRRNNHVCRYHSRLIRSLNDCLSKLDAIKRRLDGW